MDGLNTFATAQAIFLTCVLSMIMPVLQPVLLVLMGCCIGFLRVNKTPARIFMGDVGSIYLGTFLGGALLYQLSTAPATWLWPLSTLSLLFTFDATFTLIKRTINKRKPWEAHKSHLYQRLQQTGFSHEHVTLRGALINIILLTLTVIGLYTGHMFIGFVLGIVLMILIVIYIRHLEGK